MPTPRLHFLNVNQGDCTIIQHGNGRVTMVDVCNASSTKSLKAIFENEIVKAAGLAGDYQQRNSPVNPLKYLHDLGVETIFRFIVTHPDMDHMGGIRHLFNEFKVVNFWDTANCKEMGSFKGSPHDEEDWKFYQSLRQAGAPAKRLTLHSGDIGKYWNEDDNGGSGNGLTILAPTKELVDDANDCEDFNDCSYVLMYCYGNRKVVLGGDSHDKTWEHVIQEHSSSLKDIDVLIAPHHGRDSSRSWDFLKVLKPKVSLLGNAPSKYLGYQAFNNLKLEHWTNNQGGSFIVEFGDDETGIFCTNEQFAKDYTAKQGWKTRYDEDNRGWFLGALSGPV